MVHDTLQGLFAKSETSLADIKLAGWHQYGSSSGNWWFDDKDRNHQYVPHWVHELIDAAYNRGKESVRRDIKFALGMVDGHGRPIPT